MKPNARATWQIPLLELTYQGRMFKAVNTANHHDQMCHGPS